VLEKTADDFNRSHTRDRLKRARVKGIPRQAVLKPSHAAFRLQGQTFSLGDRVIMVQDSAVGGVHLSMKGVVIGVNANSIDVVWDSPFIGGLTLGGRYVAPVSFPAGLCSRSAFNEDVPSIAVSQSRSLPA
jgi:5'-3' exoribonuclease 1